MKVLLATGVQSSAVGLVTELLFLSGLTEATPCRKAKLAPQALQSKLLASLELDLAATTALTQIKPGKLWDALATDLFLANINKPVWGWADPQTVVLLDFWRQFDPQVRLLLVYDSPASNLAKVLGGITKPTSQAIAAALDEWTRWNSALLDYQQRFPDVCTLVNSQHVLAKPGAFIDKLSSHFGLTGLNANTEKEATLDSFDRLQAYLASQLLDAKHPAWALFQQLEAVTLLPASTPADSDKEDEPDTLGNPAAVKALLADSIGQLSLARQNSCLVDELTQDNELMLMQMHQVQEELEHYFLRYQELDKNFLTKQDGFVSDFWAIHQPPEVSIDMRANIAGSNWYEVESDGRWAGPASLSRLQLPPMRTGDYALELEIVDAMDIDIAKGIVIEIQDKKIPVNMSYPAGTDKFPVLCHAKLNLSHAVAKHPWAIGLRFPRLLSPADRGSEDARLLAVRVRSLKLVKL